MDSPSSRIERKIHRSCEVVPWCSKKKLARDLFWHRWWSSEIIAVIFDVICHFFSSSSAKLNYSNISRSFILIEYSIFSSHRLFDINYRTSSSIMTSLTDTSICFFFLISHSGKHSLFYSTILHLMREIAYWKKTRTIDEIYFRE